MNAVAALAAAAFLTACGLNQPRGGEGVITNPVIAATVNGRPIYVEDVRNYAVQRGYLREGEDLNASSEEFFQALEEMIEVRLLASEAEERGLDRDPEIRRRLDLARERVLYNALAEEIREGAVQPRSVERAYRENLRRLGQGEELHLRHIQFDTRDAALAAKRRLDAGERFEALALELSTDRQTAADGGDLGYADTQSLPETITQITASAPLGAVLGPVRSDAGWHLLRIDDRRRRGVESLEALRPRIQEWLFFQAMASLRDRLAAEARIERLRTPEQGQTPAPRAPPSIASSQGGASAPAQAASASAANPAAGGASAPFPFPMGPGAIYGAQPEQEPPTRPSAIAAAPAPGAAIQQAPLSADSAPQNGLQRGLVPATAPPGGGAQRPSGPAPIAPPTGAQP